MDRQIIQKLDREESKTQLRESVVSMIYDHCNVENLKHQTSNQFPTTDSNKL